MACSRPALVWVFSSSRVEAAAADNLLKEKGIEAREEVRKGEGRRDGRELGGRGGGREGREERERKERRERRQGGEKREGREREKERERREGRCEGGNEGGREGGRWGRKRGREMGEGREGGGINDTYRLCFSNVYTKLHFTV